MIDYSQVDYRHDNTLRDYQVENKRKIFAVWQKRRSVMLQMPTGTGKTRLFVSIVRDIIDYGSSHNLQPKVLLLAHRKELIEQISEHLGLKYSLPHGLIISQNIEQRHYAVQVGSVPTLYRRLSRWEGSKFDIIIVDEAHHVKAKSYKRIIDLFPDAKILGVTATPYRLNHAGFKQEFDELIISPSVSDFIKRGYLCEYDYYSIRPNSRLQQEIDRMKLDFEGDYRESEMMGVMDRDFIRADILDTYLQYAGGKKAIVYTINRTHNIHLANKFESAGISSAAIDSETPKDRRYQIVEDFRQGKIQVLFNVNIFSEGFDCPDVEVIQLARPTKSLSMFLQQVGRGLRPAEGKDKLLVLDNVGLYNKFGFPSARRKWLYHFEGQDVDETPASHNSDSDEKRVVNDIFEGREEVAMLHSSTEEEVSSIEYDTITYGYKSSFINFAGRSLDVRTVRHYVSLIETKLDGFIRKNYDQHFKSIFYTIDYNNLKVIRKTLAHDYDFIRLNNDYRRRLISALSKYISFAEWYDAQDQESFLTDAVSDIDSPTFGGDYREYFRAYLRKDGYSSYYADETIRILSDIIDQYIVKICDLKHRTVFEISDERVLRNYYHALRSDLQFAVLNKMERGRILKALKQYIDCVKEIGARRKSLSIRDDSSVFVQQDAKDQIESGFANYLETIGIKPYAVRRYVATLNDYVNPLIKQLLNPAYDNIYADQNVDSIQRIYNQLKGETEFINKNKEKNNVIDLAIRKYIDYLRKLNPSAEMEQVSAVAHQNSIKSGGQSSKDSQDDELKSKNKEIDAIESQQKNKLPIDPDVSEKKSVLLQQISNIQKRNLLIHHIEDCLNEYKLTHIVTFRYSGTSRDVEFLAPVIETELEQKIKDVDQIISLMARNKIVIPLDVRRRQELLKGQQDLQKRIRSFENWVVAYMIYHNDNQIESVYYSPDKGVYVNYKSDKVASNQ